MANGIPTAPGGLLKGLTTGLDLINSLETGRARTEERAKRGRDETRAEKKAERDALLTQIKAAGNVLKVGDLPDEIYFDNVDIIFSNTSKLMGKAYPGMDGYHKGLKDDAIALDKLRAQYEAGKINKNTYFKGALAISKNVFADPTKKERFDRGLKTADEERGILLRQEARVLLDYLQGDPAKQRLNSAVLGQSDAGRTITPKIQELIGKARENPQWGGRLAEEVDKLKKENRAALLPGTGYKTTTTGVRVMDTKEGRVALIGGKQVLYDESIHGQLLEKPLTIAQRKSEWAEMRAEELRGEGTWSEREITGKVLTELNQKFPSKTGTEVTVNLGTSTKTKLEQDIIDGSTKIESLDEIERLFKPEYLTYMGKGQAAYEKYAEKMGIPVDTDFLASLTKWHQEAKTTFFIWRKWVTGVAGGEKEMKDIAKSFPDPQRNSPTQFRANLEQARKTTKKLIIKLNMYRAAGIKNPTKEQLAEMKLEDIPDILLEGDEGDSRGPGVTVDINTAEGFLEKYGGGR
jgi:hypothetical protein